MELLGYIVIGRNRPSPGLTGQNVREVVITPHTRKYAPITGRYGDDATEPAAATATTSENATNIPDCGCRTTEFG